MKQPVGITQKVSRSTMKRRFFTRWQVMACALAGAFIIPVLQSFAADPADVGTSLLSRDFADGELGMIIQNQTAGANAVVEKLEGSSVVKVTVPVDIRANGARSQLQLTADMVTVKRDLGPYFLVSFQSTKPERAGLQIRPSLIPLSAQNVPTMGEAKTVASKRSESEDEGWTANGTAPDSNFESFSLRTMRTRTWRFSSARSRSASGLRRRSRLLSVISDTYAESLLSPPLQIHWA